ncbi:MAG: sugar ABC transporter substrate-binding protein [Rhodobacteraceae bacterium]|nr:sugar ABC transporter substrate-binding protein [Paracoccaceae bacterium]
MANIISKSLVAAAVAFTPMTAMAIDWQQSKGQEITLLLNAHPWTTAVEARLPEFEKLTGIKVNLQTYPEDLYLDRMQLAVRSKTAVADVYFASLDTVAYSQWSAGLMEPLTPFINDPSLTDANYEINDFPEGFRLSASFPPGAPDAEMYGIPITSEAYMLFYNKELVNQYLDGKVPETLEDLVASAQKISAEGEGKVFGAVARGARNVGIFDTVSGVIFDSWGEPSPALPYNIWFDGDWSKPRMTDPRIVQGMANYSGLLKAAPSNALSMDWPEATQLFKEGRAAFYIDASVFGPTFEDEAQSKVAGNVGYAPIPPATAGGNTRSGQWLWSLAIPKNSEHKNAAWLFVQWATSKDLDMTNGMATGGAPRLSTWANPEFTASLNPEFVSAVSVAMNNTSPTAVFKEGWEEGALMVIDAIHQIYSGTDPQTAAEELESNISSVIR